MFFLITALMIINFFKRNIIQLDLKDVKPFILILERHENNIQVSGAHLNSTHGIKWGRLEKTKSMQMDCDYSSLLELVYASTNLVVWLTGSGQTVFVAKLIKERKLHPMPILVTWMYCKWQDAYEQFPQVEFVYDFDWQIISLGTGSRKACMEFGIRWPNDVNGWRQAIFDKFVYGRFAPLEYDGGVFGTKRFRSG